MKKNHLKISAVLFDSTARLKSGNERVSDSRKSSLNENMLRICSYVKKNETEKGKVRI